MNEQNRDSCLHAAEVMEAAGNHLGGLLMRLRALQYQREGMTS